MGHRIGVGINAALPVSNSLFPSLIASPTISQTPHPHTFVNDNVRQENRLRRSPRRLGLRSGIFWHPDLLCPSLDFEFVALSPQLRHQCPPVYLVSTPLFRCARL
jgi:hypothetical protein